MTIAVVAVGLHTLPTTAIIIMSIIAHRYLQKEKREPFDSRFVPPQVVPVTRCVPGVPDFILIV